MAFQYLTNVSLAQAREEYLQLLKKNGLHSHTEEISVSEACGRITSEAVYAHICAPHYHASAMDGIAVMASTTFGATETTPICLTPEQYTFVDTGDPLPENYDAVIMVEDIVKEENGTVSADILKIDARFVTANDLVAAALKRHINRIPCIRFTGFQRALYT